MRIQVDHIGIAVTSLQESLDLYQGTLGFSLSLREQVDSQGVRIAMLCSGSSPEAAKLELLEPVDGQSALGRFISRSGVGLHHLAVEVDNLEEAVAKARAQGLEILGEPQTGVGNCRFVFLHPRGTGGVLLELLQRESCKS